MTEILRTKGMLTFALSFKIYKGGKSCTFHVSYFLIGVPLLIRSDGLTTEEFKEQNPLVNTVFLHL